MGDNRAARAAKMALVVGLAGLSAYVLAMMPRLRKRQGVSEFSGWYYAHRGLHDNDSDAPENSIPAFRRAVEHGFGIELDVQLTKDGVPVVHHDFNLLRSAGKFVRIGDITFEKLRDNYRLFKSDERVPSFAEVLSVVDGKVPLLVEIKCETTDMEVCRVVASMMDGYKGQWCMESFNPLCVLWFRRHRPDVVRGQLSDNFIKENAGKEEGRGMRKKVMFFMHQNLLSNFITKPDFIAFNHNFKESLALKINRKLYRVPTFAWTVQSEKALRDAKEMFDTIIFDGFMPKGKSGENA